jgi:hypothetical protein
MSESFSYVESQRVFEFSSDAVREARPDVVLETYVDRILNTQEPYRPIAGSLAPAEQQFRGARDLAWRDEVSDRFAPPQPAGRAALERDEGGLWLRVRKPPKDGLQLPAVSLAKGMVALLHVEAVCRGPVELDVFVRKEGESTFPPANHVTLQLRPEAGEATVRLPYVGWRFETLLRLRAPARELYFTKLELRRAPR